MTGHSGSSPRLGVLLVAVVAAIFLFADRDVLAVADDFDRMAARYLVDARKQTLATCRERGLELPPDFLAWIDRDPARRASVYGCRADPLTVLLALRSLEIDLGGRGRSSRLSSTGDGLCDRRFLRSTPRQGVRLE